MVPLAVSQGVIVTHKEADFMNKSSNNKATLKLRTVIGY